MQPEDHPTVIVVDDNLAKRYAVSRLLRAAGFVVKEAATGSEALARAEDGADAMVLDVNLPDMDGYQVCRMLRAMPGTKRLPIIHLSATFTEAGDKAFGMESGADGYLTHPVEAPVLIATVRAFIRARKAEAELRNSEAKFRAIFDKAMNGIVLFDNSRTIMEANPAMAKMLGLPGQSLAGMSWTRFQTTEMAVGSQQRYDELVRRGGWTGQVQLLRADRSPVYLEGHVTLHSEPDNWIGVFTDVSDRVATQEDRERLHASERDARTEAERANRLKDDFLATISHELRAPLQAIVGWSQLLRTRPPTDIEDYRAGIEAIDRNARVQAQLISDLLDVSRITSGKLRLQREVLDLAQVVANAIEAVTPSAAARGLDLQMEVGKGILPVHGDAGRLQQVLSNLLTNAIKFTPRGGRVLVRADRADTYVDLSVIDNGQGIAAELLPHLFDAFRQGEPGQSRRNEGLGLGLSIVKRLTEMHGGSVSVASAGPGQGATFTLRFPTLATSNAVAGGTGHEKPQELADTRALRGLRVLLVDDDADARLVVRRLLDDQGMLTLEAGSVGEALRMIANDRPDILVSDLSMPGEDGYALIRQLRSSGLDAEHLPALALTAFARPEDRMRVLSSGFQAHLGKPIDLESLLAAIVALAQKRVT
jgi:PAS domain S-box-containing protein